MNKSREKNKLGRIAATAKSGNFSQGNKCVESDNNTPHFVRECAVRKEEQGCSGGEGDAGVGEGTGAGVGLSPGAPDGEEGAGGRRSTLGRGRGGGRGQTPGRPILQEDYG